MKHVPYSERLGAPQAIPRESRSAAEYGGVVIRGNFPGSKRVAKRIASGPVVTPTTWRGRWLAWLRGWFK